MTEITNIIFVCLGNIVRSPLAENMFKMLLEEKNALQGCLIESAGTGAYHIGESPDSRMRRVAAERGLIYNGRARQFIGDDFDRFDLIIAMDLNNQRSILSLARSQEDREKVVLMRSFDPLAGTSTNVPDPYYGGIRGFEEVYEIVERSCKGLMDRLKETGGTL